MGVGLFTTIAGLGRKHWRGEFRAIIQQSLRGKCRRSMHAVPCHQLLM